YAPVTGEVTVTMDSGHAVGLTSENGGEVLIHVGLDTVELAGEGFVSHVEKGDKVTAGDLLIEADVDFIKEKGYDPTTIIVVTNTTEYAGIKTTDNTSISHSDELLELIPTTN
ncbi:MAG TPA: PTS glucose transporter subunit IIA, partial [Atopostipes sp.]|nr:PTS glucose transporter subunit IIA [Atopostipes sp.]